MLGDMLGHDHFEIQCLHVLAVGFLPRSLVWYILQVECYQDFKDYVLDCALCLQFIYWTEACQPHMHAGVLCCWEKCGGVGLSLVQCLPVQGIVEAPH